jgi:hypothetical protein
VEAACLANTGGISLHFTRRCRTQHRVVAPLALSRRDRRGTLPLDLSSTPSSRESAVTSRVLPAVVSPLSSLGIFRATPPQSRADQDTHTQTRRGDAGGTTHTKHK